MDIAEITLRKLLDNRLIKNIQKDGEYYFSKDALNALFEDNFKHTPHIVFTWKGKSNFMETGIFISYKEIAAQLDHIKSSPNFGNNIDRMFGFDKKK